ncbi:uncharacterized protein LOC112549188 isoform X2 [Alligator sinensis]|uniref:Uncharacterized protein LOC112549188 isoform X2 n=1 Tax=Alligator sinensis TaxID=38654 RepID=A0A3Q0FWZ5_ALLSI|nr:uncharacterized protein LOC112549188 isoform X2 [Alligator sinensis]
MAVEDDLIFESFLKKRKDKLKLTWTKYWFRLQNTTLFFFTKKHGDAMKAVCETQAMNVDYRFKIIMKNGKKKLLSAESADLRATWIKVLWRSMHLLGPDGEETACMCYDVPVVMARTQIITDGKKESLYDTILCAESFGETSRTNNFLVSEETMKTRYGHTSNYNERSSPHYRAPKMEPLEDNPDNETNHNSNKDETSVIYDIPRSRRKEIKASNDTGKISGDAKEEPGTVVWAFS